MSNDECQYCDSYCREIARLDKKSTLLKKQVEIAREVIEGSLFCDYKQKHSDEFTITSVHDYDCYKCDALEKLKELEK